MPYRSTFLAALFCLQSAAGQGIPAATPQAGGFRGIWFDLGQKSGFGSKYSGGLGTYTANHNPLAVYAPIVAR